MKTTIAFVESGSVRFNNDVTKELGLQHPFQGRVGSIKVDDTTYLNVWASTKKTGEIHLFLSVKGAGGCCGRYAGGQEVEISKG